MREGDLFKFCTSSAGVFAEVHNNWLVGCSDLFHQSLYAVSSVAFCNTLKDFIHHNFIPLSKALKRPQHRSSAADPSDKKSHTIHKEQDGKKLAEITAYSCRVFTVKKSQIECYPDREHRPEDDRHSIGQNAGKHKDRQSQHHNSEDLGDFTHPSAGFWHEFTCSDTHQKQRHPHTQTHHKECRTSQQGITGMRDKQYRATQRRCDAGTNNQG